MDKLPYSRYLVIGLGMTLAMIVILALVGILQTDQMEAAAEELNHEAQERGHEVYQEACVSCHGQDGQGSGSLVPALNSKEYLTAATDEVIFNVIYDGRPGTGMPAWGQGNGGPYNAQTVDDVVAFIRAWESTAPSKEEQPHTADLARGQSLYSNTCFACHGPSGEGTNIAPTLNDPNYLAKFDDDYLRITIQRGRPTRGMPTWGSVLSPDQIEDLVALIRSWETGSPHEAELPGGDPNRGQNLFVVACVSCHGINGFGTDLAPQPLSRPDYLRSVTDRDIFNYIAEGSTAMPSWNEVLSPAEIGDLVAYVRELPPPPPLGELVGDVANGARLYTTGCLACHGPAGQGVEGVGGPLRNNSSLASLSDEQLRTIILEGLLPNASMPPWQGELNDQEIADLVALLRSWERVPIQQEVPTETSSPAGDPAAGQAIFTQQCAACHGANAEGQGTFPGLRESDSVQAMADDELRDVISNGRANTAMSSFGGVLSGDQIDDVVAFIRSIQPGGAQPAPAQSATTTDTSASAADSALAGQSLYAQQCAPCHGASAEGQGDFPALRQSASVQAMSDDELRSAISTGKPDTLMRGFGNVLTTDQIDDLVTFLRGLQPVSAPAAPTAASGDALAGQTIFAQQCAPCHGAQAEGTENFPGLRQSASLQAMSDDELRNVISAGKPNTLMIGFADRLTGEQIGDVAAFVRSLQSAGVSAAPAPAAPSGDPLAGQTIFAQQCAPCHGAQAEGNENFPGLRQSAIVQAMSDDELHNVISAGKPNTLMIGFADRLTEEQIDDVAAFVRSLQPAGVSAAPAAPSGDTLAGQTIFAQQCAPCHGAQAEGTENFPGLRQSANVQAMSDDELHNVVSAGKPNTLMIGFADRLTDEQIDDVAAFVRSLQPAGVSAAPAPAAPTGDPLAGQTIFAQQCAPCHGAQAEGNENFPGLRQSTVVQTMSDDELHNVISAGKPNTLMLGFAGRLTDAQIDDVAAFIRSLQPAGAVPAPAAPAGGTTASPAGTGGDATAGETLYGQQCAACHGLGAEGNANFPGLRQSASLQAMSDEEMAGVISAGRTNTPMAGFAGRLSAEQIDDLVAFIRSIQ